MHYISIPVAWATGYNHFTPAGVFDWIKCYYVNLVIGKPNKINWRSFTNLVAEATGYNHISPTGLWCFHRAIYATSMKNKRRNFASFGVEKMETMTAKLVT